ncbi:MAG: hypothetical protein HQL95_10925 [Magnetococcales bacterium]|nr:hypothetical protein [Magnetococcales bacterium]
MSHYRFRAKKHVPFISLPRNRQKHQYIQAKNLIRRASGVLSGVFYTYDYMHGENGWVDGYFLGKIPPTFYNFSLETTRHAYMNLVLKQGHVKCPDNALI